MDKVIITHGWCRTAYAVLRCLKQYGVEVFVGGPEGAMMAGSSRFAAGVFHYPSPYSNPEGFVGSVVKAVRQVGAKVYIPVHEEILAVGRFRDRFPEDLKIPITTYNNLLRAYDKSSTMDFAEKIGVPVPKTYYPASLSEIEEIAEKSTFPCMIKLRRSNSAKGVFRVDSKEHLLSRYKEVLDAFPVAENSLPIIQDYIPGVVYAVSMLFDKGKPVSKFVRKNLREKTYGGGTCTKCVSVKNPTLEGYAEKMLTGMNWHGVAMMEFKYDEETDRALLLEINPRYHGTIDHDIQSGVPTPYLHYLLATGGQLPEIQEYKTGLRSRWFLGDMIGLLDHMSRSKTMRERFSYLGKILRFDEDNYMDIKRDDLKPFFAQCRYYLGKFVRTGSRNPADENMLG